MKKLFIVLSVLLFTISAWGEQKPVYYKMVPHEYWNELAKAAVEVEPYLHESGYVITRDLLCRTPAQQLREEADRMDKRDTAIRRFKRAIDAMKRYPAPCEDAGK